MSQEGTVMKMTVQMQKDSYNNCENDLTAACVQYRDNYKKRMKLQEVEEKTTERAYLAKTYHNLLATHPEEMETRFPLIDFSTKKDSEQYKKMFPLEFKKYFFFVMKNLVKQEDGTMGRSKAARPGFFLTSGKQSTVQNTKTLKPEEFSKKVQRKVIRERLWKRTDKDSDRQNLFMTADEMQNCTFEPNVGSQNPYASSLKQEGRVVADNLEFHERFGDNFQKSNPEVFKSGVLQKAQKLFDQGMYREAQLKLVDGFNLFSIERHYHNEKEKEDKKRLMRQEAANKISKAEREAKEKAAKIERAKRLGVMLVTMGFGAVAKNVHKQKQEEEEAKKSFKKRETGPPKSMFSNDDQDAMKHLKPENFKNPKIKPLLEQAWDLVNYIKKRQKFIDSNIKDLQTQKNEEEEQKNQLLMFKSIMCPLKESCPKDQRLRWPASSIRATTQFGTQCLFAHHTSEIYFPQYSLAGGNKKSKIENLEKMKDTEAPANPWLPSGDVNQRISVLTKKGFEEASQQMSKTVGRKPEDCVSSEEKEWKTLRVVHPKTGKVLTKEENFSMKFGYLKKATVLYSYNRFKEAFLTIAEAAILVKAELKKLKEIENNNKTKWKFKLGLPKNFDIPMSREELLAEPKLDASLINRMDLGEVDPAKVIIYLQKTILDEKVLLDKNIYLNSQIEIFYRQVDSELKNKYDSIKNVKKRVDELDELLDLQEGGQSVDGIKKGGFGGLKKTKMCEVVLGGGRCPEGDNCGDAHFAIELDLVTLETNIKNLTGMIGTTTKKLKESKPLDPWRPVKSGVVEDTDLMHMKSKKRKRMDDDDDEDERKPGEKEDIFERENLEKLVWDDDDE